MVDDGEGRYRFGVCGSRGYLPDDLVVNAIVRMKVTHPEGVTLITGDEPTGVDRLAIEWAKIEGIPYVSMPAHWDRLGKGAGHERNTRVVARCQSLIALFHERPFEGLHFSSPGTCDVVTQAMDAGIPVFAHHAGRWLVAGAIQTIVGQVHNRWGK